MRDWQVRHPSPAPPSGRTRLAAPGHRATAPGDLAARADGHPEDLLEIQRLAGNEAAVQLVQPVAQREPDGPAEDVDEEAAAGRANEALVEQAAAVVDAAGGIAAYHAFPADIEGNASFIVFDDASVNAAFRLLLARWGLETDAAENADGSGAPPPWAGEFRARALNVRPQAAADNPGDARMARLAGELADSVSAETPAQRIRRQAVEEIQGRVGTTVMSQAEIDAERGKVAKDGLTPANFTTCIAFFGQVMAQVMSKSGLKAPIIKGPNWYKEINEASGKESLGARWKPYTEGARPKPGDLLIFTFNADEKNKDGTIKYGEGWFAHISILRAIEPASAATGETALAEGAAERWISVDGGGTTAKEVVRTFHPETGLIVGPGSVTRKMKGWIDIEAAVEAGLVPKR